MRAADSRCFLLQGFPYSAHWSKTERYSRLTSFSRAVWGGRCLCRATSSKGQPLNLRLCCCLVRRQCSCLVARDGFGVLKVVAQWPDAKAKSEGPEVRSARNRVYFGAILVFERAPLFRR